MRLLNTSNTPTPPEWKHIFGIHVCCRLLCSVIWTWIISLTVCSVAISGDAPGLFMYKEFWVAWQFGSQIIPQNVLLKLNQNAYFIQQLYNLLLFSLVLSSFQSLFMSPVSLSYSWVISPLQMGNLRAIQLRLLDQLTVWVENEVLGVE
jgi:hypothetical protein